MAVLCSKTAFALDRPFREAQNPETFQVAPFYFPDEVREIVSHEKPEKRVLASHNIAKECGKLAIIWKNPDSFEIYPKIGNHLEKSCYPVFFCLKPFLLLPLMCLKSHLMLNGFGRTKTQTDRTHVKSPMWFSLYVEQNIVNVLAYI